MILAYALCLRVKQVRRFGHRIVPWNDSKDLWH